MQKTYEEENKRGDKEEVRNAKQKNLGITLIALVITIIVLLILSGVTLSLTLGENGLLRRAEGAKGEYTKSDVKEELEMDISELYIEKKGKGENLTKQDIADKIGNKVVILDVSEEQIDGEYKDYGIIIDENNKVIVGEKLTGEKPKVEIKNITEGEEVEVEIQVIATAIEGEIELIEAINGAELKTENSNSDKIYEVTENGEYRFRVKGTNGRTTIAVIKIENVIASNLTKEERNNLKNNGIKELGEGEITNPNLKNNENIKGVITGEVPIPTGAEYKEGTKDTGVVIAFDDSEFVWVPVPEINEMARLQSGSTENYQGVLYDFSGTTSTEMSSYGIGTTSYREPDVLTDTNLGDANTTNLTIINNILGTNYTTADQFKTVLQSDYNEMVASVIKYKGFFVGRYETSLGENKVAKSKKGVLPATAEATSANTWYGLYAYEKKMANDNGLASVKSHMIWGSQYDAMLRWALLGADKGKVATTGNATHNSSASSVYETGKVTVSGKVDRINNIYDLEGNGREWTSEASHTDGRSTRGGNYYGSGSPSYRFHNFPTYTFSNVSSRLSLYVK